MPLVLTFVYGGPIGAVTYTVLPDGTGDFPTIQQAIDAAVDGDVVELGDGTFLGTGNRDIRFLGKAITLRSQSGNPEACTIECAEVDPGVVFSGYEGPESRLEGVSICRGHGGILHGGGIHCDESAPTIENCWIYQCWPGMVCKNGASPELTDCLFRENTADQVGGALFCEGEANVSLHGCSFIANEATTWGVAAGGAIACFGSALLAVDCVFRENVAGAINAPNEGGAIYGIECDITLVSCIFDENAAVHEGGAAYLSRCSCEVTGCTFRHNNHIYGGGAIAAYDCTPLVLQESDFLFNETIAIILAGHAPVVERCVFAGNRTTWGAEAIYIGAEWISTDASIAGCTFWGNEADDSWGAIVLGDLATAEVTNTIVSGGSGVGVACRWGGVAELTCCDIHGNAGGDWVGCIADQLGVNGNISEPPLFCAPESEDFTIYDTSPCAPFSPPNPECDLIGALPVGCGLASVPDYPLPTDEPPSSVTWGSLKSLFRK